MNTEMSTRAYLGFSSHPKANFTGARKDLTPEAVKAWIERIGGWRGVTQIRNIGTRTALEMMSYAGVPLPEKSKTKNTTTHTSIAQCMAEIAKAKEALSAASSMLARLIQLNDPAMNDQKP